MRNNIKGFLVKNYLRALKNIVRRYVTNAMLLTMRI